eukprot:Lithocolla_globosa_v1_NODE_5389_length_1248_cov_5.300084.p2 type:complete len:102 gc:universal NODE_5389_length_1248_cov_5.300084:567-262(-)
MKSSRQSSSIWRMPFVCASSKWASYMQRKDKRRTRCSATKAAVNSRRFSELLGTKCPSREDSGIVGGWIRHATRPAHTPTSPPSSPTKSCSTSQPCSPSQQ